MVLNNDSRVWHAAIANPECVLVKYLVNLGLLREMITQELN